MHLILVIDIPRFMMITQMFKNCNLDQYDTSKTLTISNQSETLIKPYNSVICFSTVETKSRCFMLLFAVADNKQKILGKPSFEKYIQNLTIHDFTMNFNQSFKHQFPIDSFSTLIQMISPFFSIFYQISSKNLTYNKPNTAQTLQFPLRK